MNKKVGNSSSKHLRKNSESFITQTFKSRASEKLKTLDSFSEFS